MYTRETAKLVGQNNGFSTDHLDERKKSNALFEVCERSSVRLSYTLDTSLAGGWQCIRVSDGMKFKAQLTDNENNLK